MRRLLALLLVLGSAAFGQADLRSTTKTVIVKGRVFDASTCAGIRSVVVKFVPPRASGNPVVVTATADDGTFEADLAAVGDYYVAVSQGAQQLYGKVVKAAEGVPVLIGLGTKGQGAPGQGCGMSNPPSPSPVSRPPESAPTVQDPQHLLGGALPVGLAFLPSGMVILDGYHKRLLQARASGLAVVPTGVLQDPFDIATAQIDGRELIFLVWTNTTSGSTLTVYGTDGAIWKSWSPSVHGVFSAIAVDPNTHTTYLGIQTAVDFSVVQLGAQSVLNRQANPFLPFSNTGTVGSSESPAGPAAIDSLNARLFLASARGGLLTVDLKTPHSQPIRLPLPNSFGTPEALVYDAGGHTLYAGAGHHLWAVDVGGSPLRVSEFPPHHLFGRVTALALDSNHRLWVGDSDARALYVMSLDGQMIQTLH